MPSYRSYGSDGYGLNVIDTRTGTTFVVDSLADWKERVKARPPMMDKTMGVESEFARRRAKVDAAIASFGGPEAEYHAHIMACDACAGGYEELCAEGARLFQQMIIGQENNA